MVLHVEPVLITCPYLFSLLSDIIFSYCSHMAYVAPSPQHPHSSPFITYSYSSVPSLPMSPPCLSVLDRSQNGRQIGLVAFGGNRRNRIVISGTHKPISVSDEPTATQVLIMDELPATQLLVGNTPKTPDTARLLYGHIMIGGDDKLATNDLLYGSCDDTEDAQVNDI